MKWAVISQVFSSHCRQ